MCYCLQTITKKKHNNKMLIFNIPYVENSILRRLLGHIIYLLIVISLTPVYVYFELLVVLPNLIPEVNIVYIIHVFNGLFILFNITGNMIYGMFTDTSIQGKILGVKNDKSWTLCVICETVRPPRAWHCEICNICILKRDHHCTFLAGCVGYFNHRYFLWFTFYIFIAMIYSCIINIQYLTKFVKWNGGLLIAKFLLPLASIPFDGGQESLYIFLVDLNVILGSLTGFLFFYHLKKVLDGTVSPDAKHNKESIYNKGWNSNLAEVLGSRWYITWISPYIYSPLPGNGIDWIVDVKNK